MRRILVAAVLAASTVLTLAISAGAGGSTPCCG